MSNLHNIAQENIHTKRFCYLSKQHKKKLATREEEVEYYTWLVGNPSLADLLVGLKRQEVPQDTEAAE